MIAGMDPYDGRMDEKDAVLIDPHARGPSPRERGDARREAGPQEREPGTGYDPGPAEALDALDRGPPAYSTGSVADATRWPRRGHRHE
jgi:hypothetical protein